jgi:hypothetical protein
VLAELPDTTPRPMFVWMAEARTCRCYTGLTSRN